MTDLFAPVRVGPYHLKNRIVMSPMARARAAGHVPNDMMVAYYTQRADAGLIVSDGTAPSITGVLHERGPGVYSDEQVEAWKKITDSVHGRGGRIFLQLLHAGRATHPSLIPNGATPVAPSPIALTKPLASYPVLAPVTPHPLSIEEITDLVEDFRRAANNARRAGFDGIELHAANGYLLDQFLRNNSNRRTDRYGGSPENRFRLVREIVAAVSEVIGSDRVGIKISPANDRYDTSDSDPELIFRYVVDELDKLGLAYLHITEGSNAAPASSSWLTARYFRSRWNGVLIANRHYDLTRATAALADRTADLISFGRLFIANPDLVRRFRERAALNFWDERTFESAGPQGYLDYPTLA